MKSSLSGVLSGLCWLDNSSPPLEYKMRRIRFKTLIRGVSLGTLIYFLSLQSKPKTVPVMLVPVNNSGKKKMTYGSINIKFLYYKLETCK